jgi:hypothetical protein
MMDSKRTKSLMGSLRRDVGLSRSPRANRAAAAAELALTQILIAGAAALTAGWTAFLFWAARRLFTG